jgi:CubicO group peptidase (beta-lactamase class C family)
MIRHAPETALDKQRKASDAGPYRACALTRLQILTSYQLQMITQTIKHSSMRNRAIVVFLLSLLHFPVFVQAQTTGKTIDSLVDKISGPLLKKDSNAAVFVAFAGKTKPWYCGKGYADSSRRTLFSEHTLFEAGSITKTFTAYVLLKVLAEKNISDTEKIESWLPDSLRTNASLGRISFRQLLSHTSGLPRMPSNFEAQITNDLQPYANYTYHHFFSFLKTISIKDTIHPHNYSNLGFALAGHLASTIAGKPYKQLLDEYIFRPCNIHKEGEMKNAVYATGYIEQQRADIWDLKIFYPAGGIILNAKDMLVYLKELANPSVLDKRIVEQMLTPVASVRPNTSVAYGWHISKTGHGDVYWHNGGTYGFSTFCAFRKSTTDAVIVVVNQFNENAISDQLGMLAMDITGSK